jgi:hypothetical protein
MHQGATIDGELKHRANTDEKPTLKLAASKEA